MAVFCCCRLDGGLLAGNVDSLDLEVLVESLLAVLAADTALLVAAEGKLGAGSTVLVDPDSTSLEVLGDVEGSVERLGVETGSETVLGVVGLLDDLVKSAEG